MCESEFTPPNIEATKVLRRIVESATLTRKLISPP